MGIYNSCLRGLRCGKVNCTMNRFGPSGDPKNHRSLHPRLSPAFAARCTDHTDLELKCDTPRQLYGLARLTDAEHNCRRSAVPVNIHSLSTWPTLRASSTHYNLRQTCLHPISVQIRLGLAHLRRLHNHPLGNVRLHVAQPHTRGNAR